MSTQNSQSQLAEIAGRIKELRDIFGYSTAEMADKTGISEKEYRDYETGLVDFPFTFTYKCAQVFGVQMTELLEGHSAKLRSYTVTRKGQGQNTAKEEGIEIANLAPNLADKLGEPYYVKYEYSSKQQNMPIHTTTHAGQEFDYIVSGSLLVQVGDNREVLKEGDSILYNSSTPHGMIAVDGKDCEFLAIIFPGEETPEEDIMETVISARSTTQLIAEKYVKTAEDRRGALTSIHFENTEDFNFGFDIVDAIAAKYPDKLAMIHLDKHMKERRFSFKDMMEESNRTANYFRSLGIKKGDPVMLVLKRHYQFWFCMLALEKIGAVAIPATYLLKEHDFEYRFNAASVKAIVCTADGDTADMVDAVLDRCPSLNTRVMVGGMAPGWHDFDEEYQMYRKTFRRPSDCSCGDDTAIMFFSSGTTGDPKMVKHSHTYSLGHFVTARYWHCCERDGLHLTISDTGWGKSLWGKFYGQWLCEGAVFVYDFDRFNAQDILPLFKKYNITTFCAPPTMLRMMIKEDLSNYDFSSVHHMTTAGEALNPEVYRQFEQKTGLQIMEGFGQTETTLTIANLTGTTVKIGSMGKASPQYKVVLMSRDGRLCPDGETGEICIDLREGAPAGLFKEYYRDEDLTSQVIRDGYYHTGDTAWRDEDGYFWYVGRVDDIIKSSGYRIGPFEIESVIMELPYVLECGVSAAPDEVRGQIVKASIVLAKGVEGTDELKKEIQDYVKQHTAPYKYPRLVVFRDSLPKTISGKIQRSKL